METPNYYGILPANVRYDKELKPMEKIMYTEITALSNKNGYCNASNSYFAELYECSKETVSRWISNLEKQGYIETELIFKKNTKIIEERRMYIVTIDKKINTYCEKNQEGIDKKINTPIDEKVKGNNTSINNTRLILIKEKYKKEKTNYEGTDEEINQKENEAVELIEETNYSKEVKEYIYHWWFGVKPKALKKKLKSNNSLKQLLTRDYIFNSPYLSTFIELSEERLWIDLLPQCWESFMKNINADKKLRGKKKEKIKEVPKQVIKNDYTWDIENL